MISGGNGEEVPPVPIPNTEVKLFSADDTWLDTARESRSPPDSINCSMKMLQFFFISESERKHWMITLDRAEKHFNVKRDGISIGKVGFRCNPFHQRNAYLDFDLCEYNCDDARSLFQKLSNALEKPLQTMISSGDHRMQDYLLAGGFACKRRCYEVEATRDEYLGNWSIQELSIACRGDMKYAACCNLMYAYYQRTHEEINPLTVTLEQFIDAMPDQAYYQEIDGCLNHIAFFEDNEIAYVATKDDRLFKEFAAAVVSCILSEHQCVNFESDDCDSAAMILRSLFLHDDESYDTYIYDK